MPNKESKFFFEAVIIFHEKRLPEAAVPVGYAALIHAYELSVPLPRVLSAICTRHSVFEKDGWRILTPRHKPNLTLEGQLVFALKYEGVDLVVLKRLFDVVQPQEIAAMISSKPTSSYMRRIWFLYEWLLDKPLDLPDAKTGSYVEVLDEKQQYAGKGKNSTRHRVKNNLPGTRNFCPLVFRTPKIDAYIAQDLAGRAQKAVGNISADILARTAAFLLLKDSKSSYAIEGESPPQNRIQRWGRAIGEAGKQPLDLPELLRLQKIVIGNDNRFIEMGLRQGGGFVGEHDRESRLPLPEHISARHEDLPSLVQGLIDFDTQYAGKVDAVLAASVLAFGFVYIHPFGDGNGRIHRYLIHHVLSERGFNPPGVVFPVSAPILERLDEYRRVLESYSKRLLPLIDWEPAEKMNVRVLNDTGDYYRYFDATPHVEFLYSCVEQTIEVDLPQEIRFLQRYDQFKAKIEALIEMPASTVDLLFNFLKQNEGVLSKRAREKEFAALKESEVEYIEATYSEIFSS
ncbi:Fic family protein [Ravibacter arvi]|uniref:Fic family protein n=1 Tax=Ravibacter arvi TaxID=2051041 RepID=A0ABP8MBL9_9BACT